MLFNFLRSTMFFLILSGSLPTHAKDVVSEIAALTIKACSTHNPRITCPSREAFTRIRATIVSDPKFRESIDRLKKRELVYAHMEGKIGGQIFADTRVSSAMTTSQSDSNVFSDEYLLAGVLRGLFTLHLFPSNATTVRLTQNQIEFVAGFKDSTGESLFGNAVNRAAAAVELRELGLRHTFLLNQTQWLVNDQLVEFGFAEDDMYTVYMKLMEASHPRQIL